MALLTLGTPLAWSNSQGHSDHVRQHGIRQFLAVWRRLSARRKDHLLWGDELEYMVVDCNAGKKTARLSLYAGDALESLTATQSTHKQASSSIPPPIGAWHPEYGQYMIEGTPAAPYGATLRDLLTVYDNMVARRKEGQAALPENHLLITLTNFPLLGRIPFIQGQDVESSPMPYTPNPVKGVTRSLFIPDEAIAKHVRFPTLTENIRTRRGSKVAINVPIFKDKYTPSPFVEACPPYLPPPYQGKSILEIEPDAKPDHIYMDAMCFGMGCCCLQVTFQACSVQEARRLYDQLATVTPILLALSAGSPLYRGYVSDVDCRWNVISASVDDRTPEERGILPLESSQSRFRICKSRYDSISCYLSPGPDYSEGSCNSPPLAFDSGAEKPISPYQYPSRLNYYKSSYNDLNLTVDPEIYQQLIDGGVDNELARHYAHLFIRDPLVVYQELLDQNDEESTDHFENIQSTNWQTMRFKPPPPSAPNMGWRVEFRSMEIQLTDKENAAFSIFVVLLTRTILAFDLNFYIPLSKVDENMQRAQLRDAVLNQKFWFRTKIFGNPDHLPRPLNQFPFPINQGQDMEELSVDEIMNGKEDSTFPGLIPLIRTYLLCKCMHSGTCRSGASPIAAVGLSDEEREELCAYLAILQHKASGALRTGASWIRQFVTGHATYKQDSVVPDEAVYDLMMALKKMSDSVIVPGLNAL